MQRVAHLTSVHPRYDTRILLKECSSLAKAGYEVFLVVADGRGDQEYKGVYIHDVGKPRGRIDRMTRVSCRVASRARQLDADIYHLHDPELLSIALSLKKKGKRVIYDAHEDLPAQILSKTYIRSVFRRSISRVAGWVEHCICSRLDGVVAATPAIRDNFSSAEIEADVVANYPMVGEFAPSAARQQVPPQVCYLGGISTVRGIRELISSLSLTRASVQLNLAGVFNENGLREHVSSLPEWGMVNDLGFLSRSHIADVLARSSVGVVNLHPTRAFLPSLPIKMFEYMSAGLPVIASNFPLWREIIEGNDCGLCVDPLDPQAIADAIDYLVEHPEIARRMGENGRKAVRERYNWSMEERKLIALYERLFEAPRDAASNLASA